MQVSLTRRWVFFFFQAEDGIRDSSVTGVQTCALPIYTLAAFYKALEEGQQIADTSRAAVEDAMVDMPAPFGVSRVTAAVMAVDSYPVNAGPAGTVGTVRLERVVPRMQQFLGVRPFNIGSLLVNSRPAGPEPQPPPAAP